ncbi:MAG: type I DNA topoisomerase [Candidatus Mcinerneyibacterium aminivorans]|uniref:DNA topoisomerase 1 n=1 Tax=Candidatus Mcinerneyibacterium aminivorans TaxID=2703815 RepID=A0A5D0MJC3_9BACT|nr:MAG: type I DNA topoisomerase [Candidatus Mcinerneyibacterium aminivorans]
MKGLIVVESPTKVKTIKKFVGKKYEVLATKGHVRDLPKSKLGIDLDNFEPKYVTIRGKGKVLKNIEKKAKNKDLVVLATDPDREGEAIAYHVKQRVDKKIDKVDVKRAKITEITQNGVKQALDSLSDIDINMYRSQQTRRMLDRLVGYKISPILWKIFYKGLSAGRVQSVALRILEERERKILNFVPQKYWLFYLLKDPIKAKLYKISNKRIKKVKSEEKRDEIKNDLNKNDYFIDKIKHNIKTKYPKPPFKTSSLQRWAYNIYRFSAKKTMVIAQQLYEGIDLKEGTEGLITYMRTDSHRISKDALKNARRFIKENIGDKHLPKKPKYYTKKSKGKVQDAHEAIRPTNVNYKPEKIKKYLSKDQYKLYKLIWDRFVSCQMVSSKYDKYQLIIKNGKYSFRSQYQKLKFPGFEKVYRYDLKEEKELNFKDLNEGDKFEYDKLDIEEKETNPPPRYTDASLVKKLEKLGIGRPSTYASIISVLLRRKYTVRYGRKLKVTELGLIISKYLKKLFPRIMDYQFTSDMEDKLDQIEEGNAEYKRILTEFYKKLKKWIEKADNKTAKLKEEVETITDIKCDQCSKPMKIKWGRNGKFLACTGYPDCKNTKDFEKKDGKIVVNEGNIYKDKKCPKCGGNLLIKYGRYGKFLACENYPECKHTENYVEKVGIDCPKCEDGDIIVKRSKKRRKKFYGCSNYPDCDYVSWYEPVDKKCPKCEKLLYKKKNKLVCLNKECDYEKD